MKASQRIPSAFRNRFSSAASCIHKKKKKKRLHPQQNNAWSGVESGPPQRYRGEKKGELIEAPGNKMLLDEIGRLLQLVKLPKRLGRVE